MSAQRRIALLDLAPRDDVFYGDGALRRLASTLTELGHDVTPFHSVRATFPGGDDAWHAALTRFVADGGFDVIVPSRAWEEALVRALRAGMRAGAVLVRVTDGTKAALDGAFDHVVDHAGLVALVSGEDAPATAVFTRRTASELRERQRSLPRADEPRVETVGGRPAISGPNSGCPYMLDARRLPVFAALELDTSVIQTKGCTFCLDQTGAYADAGREATVQAWLAGLTAVRRADPDVREVLLTDERPHPNLPALFEAIRTRPALHRVELLVKSRVDWLLTYADTALAEACTLAEQSGSVLHVYLVGFECFDETHLALFNKGVTTADNVRAVEVLHALEVRFPRSFEFRRLRAHGFVAFTPWSTPETLIENARWMRAVRFETLRAEAYRTRLRLYPRTPLHALAASQSLLLEAHAPGRGDRAAEQGYDASVPWRFRDARMDAVYQVVGALRRFDGSITDADVLELAARYVARFPALASVPGDAHLPLLRALATWPLRPAEAIAALGAACILDAEIDGILAGRKRGALKELVPSEDVDGLVRAYRAMGLASACVEHHGLDALGNRHESGRSRAIVAVARDEATLAEVIDRQRARDVDAMGALMGYPACCVQAFAAQVDRRDNMENERLAFRRHPRAVLDPLLRRLGPLRMVSHHPCAPDCAASVSLARALLADIAREDEAAAARMEDELRAPVLALDHSRTYLLDGAWTDDVFRFRAISKVGPSAVGVVPERARALRLRRDGVDWLGEDDAKIGASAAERPLLVVPGERLTNAAFDALGGRAAPPLEWIELTPDYRCNNACVGCFSVDANGPSMTSKEAAQALARGRRTGARALWLGGGEPSIRKDLFPLVREARRLGYDRVRLQTNGMMLAYEAFARRCAEDGITEISLSLKGATASTHDRLTRTPGCFDLVVKGAQNAREQGVTLEADVLVYASNAHELPEIVSRFHALGVVRFRLWMLSPAASRDPDVRSEVPRISDVMPHIVAAMDLGLSEDPDHIVSLHTPACTVPESHRRACFDATALALLVVNPGGHEFRLETSSMEGGVYLPGCARCVRRPLCGGVRQDYLDIHGEAEIVPILDEAPKSTT